MKKKSRRSLFVELLGAICAIVITVFAVNVTLAIFTAREPLKDLAHQNLEYFARTRVEAVDRHLNACAEEISVWSGFTMMDDALIGDPHLQITNLLIGLQRDRPDTYLELTVATPEGTIGRFRKVDEVFLGEQVVHPVGRTLDQEGVAEGQFDMATDGITITEAVFSGFQATQPEAAGQHPVTVGMLPL